MAQVKFSSSLPGHAREVWQERARAAGMTESAWLARAIYSQGVRDAAADPVDPDVAAFLNAAEADRAGLLAPGQAAAAA